MKTLKKTIDFIKNQGYKQCPKCLFMIAKEKSSNFLACQSTTCKGQTFFCYLCNKLLTQRDNYSHYENDDPWGNKCKGLEIITQSEKQIKIVNQCPQCQIQDPEICVTLSNIPFLCYCKSEYCKKSYYCLHCSKQLKNPDEEILDHIDGKCKRKRFYFCQIY
eukprot:TRINITY_DN5420_c0_g1_i2.p3 TRINITY_DN5420_c0_g1~~TRINITY_DN5420_c0_g1_i2.p3  ORF type:complete len:162 (-),score=23.00 TRINITY_DN5420_c0_g1_i2:157-642(-)